MESGVLLLGLFLQLVLQSGHLTLELSFQLNSFFKQLFLHLNKSIKTLPPSVQNTEIYSFVLKLIKINSSTNHELFKRLTHFEIYPKSKLNFEKFWNKGHLNGLSFIYFPYCRDRLFIHSFPSDPTVEFWKVALTIAKEELNHWEFF